MLQPSERGFNRRFLALSDTSNPSKTPFMAIAAKLVQATNAQRVLEVGTSNGYSTLWLAQVVRMTAGHVTTIELSEFKLDMAKRNFDRSGLSDVITQRKGEAGGLLESMENGCFDRLGEGRP